MRKVLLVIFFISSVILTPHITRAADARCCNRREDNCSYGVNCKYNCRIKPVDAPCNAANNEEEADCLGQAWHNLNAGIACAELSKKFEAELKQTQDATEQARVFSEIKPKLQIPLAPNFQFSALLKQDVEEGDTTATYLYIPYLAEYFSMLYKYLISIAGVLAGIMIVIAGFEWLVAAGDASKIKHAKERISNALIGLILALGSYTILYLVNPDLVTFKALKVPYVQYEESATDDSPDVETGIADAGGPGNASLVTQTCNASGIQAAAEELVSSPTCIGPNHCVWFVNRALNRAGCPVNQSNVGYGKSLKNSLLAAGWQTVTGALRDNMEKVNKIAVIRNRSHYALVVRTGTGNTNNDFTCYESNWATIKQAKLIFLVNGGSNCDAYTRDGSCAACERFPQEGPSPDMSNGTARWRIGNSSLYFDPAKQNLKNQAFIKHALGSCGKSTEFFTLP